MTAAERELDDQSTALLSALPREERRDILLPDALKYREEKERTIIAPVLAIRPGGGEAPGDRLQVEAEFEICGRILDAAGLSERERCVFVLHAQQGLSDQVIAFTLGRSRWTVNTTRKRAEEKIRKAVAAAAIEPA